MNASSASHAVGCCSEEQQNPLVQTNMDSVRLGPTPAVLPGHCDQGQTLQSAGPRTHRPWWPTRAGSSKKMTTNKVQLSAGLKFNTQNEGNMALNRNNWHSHTFPHKVPSGVTHPVSAATELLCLQKVTAFFVLLCGGIFCSSDRILLPPEGGLESFPDAAFGLGFLLHGHDGLLLLPADLTHQRMEHVVDVVAEGSRRLEEGAAEFPCQGRAFLFGHLGNEGTPWSGKPNPSACPCFAHSLPARTLRVPGQTVSTHLQRFSLQTCSPFHSSLLWRCKRLSGHSQKNKLQRILLFFDLNLQAV